LFRFVFGAILAIAFTAYGAPAEPGQLDASPTLFTVMAAINAAGYDADIGSTNNHPLRAAVRAELAKRNIPSLPALKEFFARHRQRNDTLELSQYISFALTAGGPPDFAVNMRDVEIPPDVSSMLELSGLLSAFYKEAGIEELWKRSQNAIDQYLGRYHAGVIQAVTQVNAYMRQQTSGFKGRRFQIYVELLAAPNQVQTRSYGNQYTIVLTPSPDPRLFDIRHAYLVYLLDPLATRNEEILNRKKGLIDHAQRAPALSDALKEDFLLLTTQSLAKAVEARLDHTPAAVGEALAQGYILTPHFAEQLPAFEKQEQAMLFYYADMVKAIDLVKEDARLSNVEFAREAPVRTVKAAPPPAPPPPSGAAKTLEDAEQRYRAGDFDGARQLFLAALQQTDARPAQASAYYGLGRVAVKRNDPETGQRMFEKVLELEPEPFVKSWALVFLGRLSLASGDADQAARRFQGALSVEGASDEARKAARQGLDQTTKQQPSSKEFQ
jgi:tetratricopeptide (TPR) repeat protein